MNNYGLLSLSDIYPQIKYQNCFDTLIISDTELFVDPFAVFEEKEGIFKGSHEKIMKFFNEAFILASKSGGDINSLSYKKLLNILLFPEINELGLGYSTSNKGAGSSKTYRTQIVNSIFYSIKRGLEKFEHFEEVGIFEQGFGCDRISDIVCNIIKEELIVYTQAICKSCDIPLKEVPIRHASFDFANLRWIDKSVYLPFIEAHNKAIILVPKRFLNDLPTINQNGFLDYVWDNKNEEIRNDFNYSIKNNINKNDIIDIAKSHPDWVMEYEKYIESKGYTGYSFSNDKKGILLINNDKTKAYIENKEIFKIDPNNLEECILEMCSDFKNYIENNEGYTLLWTGNEHKSEKAVQSLLFGFIYLICKKNNIDISKESNAGSGPVDFKLSVGYESRVLIETKLMSNTRYKNGLHKQLPKYLLAEGVKKGIFMLIAFTSDEYNKANKFIDEIKELDLPYDISVLLIDATKDKPSASKL